MAQLNLAVLSALILLSISNAFAQSQQLASCANVMPLGDSITIGVNGGYRNELYSSLQQNNCGVSYVGTQYDEYTRVPDKDHEGHSSFTIADITREVQGWLQATQPDIITLMIGSNDIWSWNAETPEEIGARHDTLIERIRNARPNAWIFVASIPPQASKLIPPNNVDRAVHAVQFNAVMQRNVQARAAAGQRVRFVDVHSALTTADLYDGLHPTEEAHAAVARRFVDAIRAALGPPGPPPVPAPAPPPTSQPIATRLQHPIATPPAAPEESIAPPRGGGGALQPLWCLLFLRRRAH